jgi:hypothetical protein
MLHGEVGMNLRFLKKKRKQGRVREESAFSDKKKAGRI